MTDYTIEYSGRTYVVDGNLSDEDIRASMSRIFDELKNARVLRDPVAKTIKFQVAAGTKGAGNDYTIEYSGRTYVVDGNLSDEDIRASMSRIFDELKNARVLRDPVGKTIKFQVAAGTKGN